MTDSSVLTVKGARIPRMGFGTWQLTGSDCLEGVRHALEIGYRHVDTARAYGNEREVGRGLADSGVPRDEVFLTTKVWLEDLAPEPLVASAQASLRDLRLDHVDLLLIHWPSHDVPLEATLEAMRGLQERGLVGFLGVSNFPPGLFAQALELAPVVTNQVEFHPFLGQDALLRVAADEDSSITAYSPLARGRILDDPTIRDVAEARGATPAQVSLAWLLHHERVVVVPKASSAERRAENLGALTLDLSDADLQRIGGLPKNRRDSDPSWAPDWAA